MMLVFIMKPLCFNVQPCIPCHILLTLQGGKSLSSFGLGFRFWGLGLNLNVQTFSTKVDVVEKVVHFHQCLRLLIQTLVWRCFDKLDFDEMVRPQSGHLNGIVSFF